MCQSITQQFISYTLNSIYRQGDMFRPSLGHPQALKENRFKKFTVRKNEIKKSLYETVIQFNTLFYYLILQLINQYLQNTCILQFILYLYNILWAFGIPQCVSVRHICNLASVFFEGLRMTQWRSKHVALSIYCLMYMK